MYKYIKYTVMQDNLIQVNKIQTQHVQITGTWTH
jgi:hypothetical protein